MGTECAACLTVAEADVDEMAVGYIEQLLEKWVEATAEDWRELSGFHPLLGDIRMVEQVGGEGEGDHAHLVWRVGDRLFRKDGYHQSHSGTFFDGDLYVVQRREKTVTVYE